MKTMTFTNDEIALIADAIDVMYENHDDVMCDEASMTITGVNENNVCPDVAVKRIIELCRENARIAVLRERLNNK